MLRFRVVLCAQTSNTYQHSILHPQNSWDRKWQTGRHTINGCSNIHKGSNPCRVMKNLSLYLEAQDPTGSHRGGSICSCPVMPSCQAFMVPRVDWTWWNHGNFPVQLHCKYSAASRWHASMPTDNAERRRFAKPFVPLRTAATRDVLTSFNY